MATNNPYCDPTTSCRITAREYQKPPAGKRESPSFVSYAASCIDHRKGKVDYNLREVSLLGMSSETTTTRLETLTESILFRLLNFLLVFLWIGDYGFMFLGWFPGKVWWKRFATV